MNTPERRRRRPESQFRQFLQTYRFEIIWLAIVALGSFLIIERLNIRSSLTAWFRRFVAASEHTVGHAGGTVAGLLAQITLSDAIGYVLVLGAVAAIGLRVRWRLLRNPALTTVRCPWCSGHIHRVHRHAVDRLISLYVPVRRYSCENDQCRWHGLRVGFGHGSGRSSTRGRS